MFINVQENHKQKSDKNHLKTSKQSKTIDLGDLLHMCVGEEILKKAYIVS